MSLATKIDWAHHVSQWKLFFFIDRRFQSHSILLPCVYPDSAIDLPLITKRLSSSYINVHSLELI